MLARIGSTFLLQKERLGYQAVYVEKDEESSVVVIARPCTGLE